MRPKLLFIWQYSVSSLLEATAIKIVVSGGTFHCVLWGQRQVTVRT